MYVCMYVCTYVRMYVRTHARTHAHTHTHTYILTYIYIYIYIQICFTTTNGVRQGRIFAPRLFTLYIDDLSNLLHNLNIVSLVSFTCVNHLFYANDICLLASSAMGLLQLINVCEQYGS